MARVLFGALGGAAIAVALIGAWAVWYFKDVWR